MNEYTWEHGLTLRAYSEVDKALCDLDGNAAAVRLSEDRRVFEALARELSVIIPSLKGIPPGKELRLSFRMEDMGEVTIQDGSGGQIQAYRSYFVCSLHGASNSKRHTKSGDYLVLKPEMGDAEIARIIAWLEAQGIAL